MTQCGFGCLKQNIVGEFNKKRESEDIHCLNESSVRDMCTELILFCL